MRTAIRTPAILLLATLLAAGCSSISGGRPTYVPKVRTLTSIGDKALATTAGTPGASATVTLGEEPEEAPALADASISGHVTDDQGRPVAGAEVRVAVGGEGAGRLVRSRTDDAGGFTLHGLRAGAEYQLVAESEDGRTYQVGQRRAQAGDRRVRIALHDPDAPPSRAGRVRTASDNREAADRDLDFDDADQPTALNKDDTFDDEDGDLLPASRSRPEANVLPGRSPSAWRGDEDPNGPTEARPPESDPLPPARERPLPSARAEPAPAEPPPAEPPAPEPAPVASPAPVVPRPSDPVIPPVEPATAPAPAAAPAADVPAPPVIPDLEPGPAAPAPAPAPPAENPPALAPPDTPSAEPPAATPPTSPEPPAPAPDPRPEPPVAPESPPAVSEASPVVEPTDSGPAAAPAEVVPPAHSEPAPPEPEASPPAEPPPAQAARKVPSWGEVVAAKAPQPPRAPEPALAGPALMRPSDGPVSCDFDAKNQRVVDFRLKDLQGRTFRFQDLDSDLVLVDFWGTWCQPCVTSIPHLIALQERYGKKRLKVVGVACEQGPAEGRNARVIDVARRLGINYAVVLSGESDAGPCPLQQALHVQVYPTMVLLDRNGRILWRDQGATGPTLERLDRVIASNTAADPEVIRR